MTDTPTPCVGGMVRPSGAGRRRACIQASRWVRDGPAAAADPHVEGGTSRHAGRPDARWRSEEGGATLMALGLVAFVMLAGMLAVDVAALAAARATAQTAADMAALAALTPGGGSPGAAGIAAANGTELASCDCSAVQAVVTVRRRVPLAPVGLSVWVTARAKAVLGVPADPPTPADPGRERRPEPGEGRTRDRRTGEP